MDGTFAQMTQANNAWFFGLMALFLVVGALVALANVCVELQVVKPGVRALGRGAELLAARAAQARAQTADTDAELAATLARRLGMTEELVWEMIAEGRLTIQDRPRG